MSSTNWTILIGFSRVSWFAIFLLWKADSSTPFRPMNVANQSADSFENVFSTAFNFVEAFYRPQWSSPI